MSLLLTDGLAALGGTIKPTPRREEPAAAGSSLTSCPYLATYKVGRYAGQAAAPEARSCCRKELRMMRGRCGRTSFASGAGRARLGRKSGVGMAVRFALGAQGTHNQKPPPGPPRPPPSLCFPAHYLPLLAAHFCPLLPGIARNCSGGGGALSKCPQLPSPSGLLPLRRTQNESMLRKGNVPDCVDGAERNLPPGPPALYIECGAEACQRCRNARK